MTTQDVGKALIPARKAIRTNKRAREAAGTGDRETNKADKRERIKFAARSLFSKAGYERTTVRQIAHKAGVALGTLSLYAKDKRDLVLLTFNDEIAEMIDEARGSVRTNVGFLDNLISYFGVFYNRFGRNPTLARSFLQLNFFSEGMHTADLDRNRESMIAGLCEVVNLGKAQKRLSSAEQSELIAQSVFFVYVGAVRLWIAQARPNTKAGLADLRQLLRLQANGYKYDPRLEATKISPSMAADPGIPRCQIRS